MLSARNAVLYLGFSLIFAAHPWLLESSLISQEEPDSTEVNVQYQEPTKEEWLDEYQGFLEDSVDGVPNDYSYAQDRFDVLTVKERKDFALLSSLLYSVHDTSVDIFETFQLVNKRIDEINNMTTPDLIESSMDKQLAGAALDEEYFPVLVELVDEYRSLLHEAKEILVTLPEPEQLMLEYIMDQHLTELQQMEPYFGPAAQHSHVILAPLAKETFTDGLQRRG
ncbi:hypothetical protein BV898_11214 [Hypsibius exemplaris]|uniref:Uncharacterized protein n=1 Tax=Hypsibius exemplaris TaxID=2072580 RepID=A0A1W0WHB3_HYPEX|nr:hypothetical protein BV898_11214 [Hypsibius exemplaris]